MQTNYPKIGQECIAKIKPASFPIINGNTIAHSYYWSEQKLYSYCPSPNREYFLNMLKCLKISQIIHCLTRNSDLNIECSNPIIWLCTVVGN